MFERSSRLPIVAGITAASALGLFMLFKFCTVYNEAGYQTHVRTIFGEEKVVTDVGYATTWFGRATAWKQAQTVQFTTGDIQNLGDETTGAVKNYRIVFLGNVDGGVEASTRFRLPQGEQFLKIAREYRSPENFVATALIPAVKETLQSTASLMSADDYFSGARSEFGSEFENQLRQGQYITKRKEVITKTARGRNEAGGLMSGADISGSTDDDSRRSIFVTEKVLDDKNEPRRKAQQFIAMGVEVVEARITNIEPNPLYKDRMVKVQTALAELAVARQARLKEEEEKLLVTARGEKEVEQKRQETLRDQIEATTKAQTTKKLAVINAEREKERAEIERQTASLIFEKAKIDAQSTKTIADASAYAKEAEIKANGALEQKLEAMVKINQVWAEAATKAPVPGIVMGGSQGGATSRQDEIAQMMGIMAVKAAKDLQLDMNVTK
ncbi:SPFH domain-containing protein (plasmid) [Pseudomonas sp. FeN3W]|nr:SPFH domain-containing protein [Pseudomonas sp. FeN3W]